MNAWNPTRDALRTALVLAVLGEPTRLPAPASVDLQRFWHQFDATAPAHLRWGFEAATVLLGAVLPALLGHGRTLPHMTAAARDAYIHRVAGLPVAADLIQIVKVVAALGYFADEGVEDAARGVSP